LGGVAVRVWRIRSKAPAQIGHAFAPPVRSRTLARHSWPSGQRHQAGWSEVAPTVAGVAERLRVRCHSRAIFGYRLAREFVTLTLRLRQKGHDAFVRTVGATRACH
jgi:hypothetical protein